MIGVVVSTVAWVGGIWPKGDAPRGAPVTVERVAPDNTLLVLRHRGRSTEVLTSSADGKLVWMPISPPNSSRSNP